MKSTTTQKQFLSWRDFCDLFGCGRSKALLLMREVGVVYIGKTAFVRADVLEEYLQKHGEIATTWPKKR